MSGFLQVKNHLGDDTLLSVDEILAINTGHEAVLLQTSFGTHAITSTSPTVLAEAIAMTISEKITGIIHVDETGNLIQRQLNGSHTQQHAIWIQPADKK